ncbi:MAG: (d)CMP kinase [Rickettsiales bacterium]|nr:(d)CMP kinase [Rickettsiales bacterium]
MNKKIVDKFLVIAIDGPASSGKGTLAKKIAAHFNLPYLNTGALYRLIAWRIIDQKIAPNNFAIHLENLVKNISATDLENEDLFDEEVGSLASVIAKDKNLRAALLDFQKNFVAKSKKEKNGCVLDGRDTTTVICPDANYKFFVTAAVEIRAQRRAQQLKTSYEEILAQLKKRDENDFNRQDAPLKISADAHVIDNGNLSIDEGFKKILKIISA